MIENLKASISESITDEKGKALTFESINGKKIGKKR
jgi:hypothetical protein